MSYTDVFGGSPVQPSQVAYRGFTISANTTLQWPVSNQNTTNAAARIMQVTASTSGLTLTMPPADEVSAGQDALIYNVGAETFTVANADGGTITTIAAGVSKYLWITGNADEAGTWTTITFGTGTSAADASALAGYGLTAIGATLNANNPVTELTTAYTVQTTDRAKVFNWNTGSGTLSLMAAASYGTNGFLFYIINLGSGALTVDPNGSETINEASTLTINPGESCVIFTDGVSWYAIGQGRSVNFAWNQLNKNVAGSSDVTLTSAEAGNGIMRFFGALTGNISVIVPTAVNQWTIINDTSGSFTLTIRTAAGTGVGISQGDSLIMRCDGTDVFLSNDGTASIAATFPDGSASAPSISFTSNTGYGFFLATNPGVGISAGGVVKTLVATGAVSDYVQNLGATGSASAPQYSFTSASTTGLYLASTALLGISVAGTSVLTSATSGHDFQQQTVTDYVDKVASYTATGLVTLSTLPSGQIHLVTMTATSTILLPNVTVASGSEATVVVEILQNGTGGYTPTFSATDASRTIAWTGGSSQPTANTTASKETDYAFRLRGGTTVWRGTQIWIEG